MPLPSCENRRAFGRGIKDHELSFMNKKKKSLADLFERTRAARAAMGEAKWAVYQLEQRTIAAESQTRIRREFDDFLKSPESAARDALEHGLNELKNNATIQQSGTCIEALDAFLYCVTYMWGARDSEKLLSPIGRAFGRLSAKKASKAPRPKARSKFKVAVGTAMWDGKKHSQDFKTFMQMWELGHIGGMTVRAIKDSDKYRICDENGDLGEKTYTKLTLERMYSQLG